MAIETKKIVAAVFGILGAISLTILLTREQPIEEWPPPAPDDPTKATAYGQVFDADYKTYPMITVEYIRFGGGYYYTAVTNSEGKYVLENIEPGKYMVQLYDSAGNPCGWRQATLVAGEANSVNIVTTLAG